MRVTNCLTRIDAVDDLRIAHHDRAVDQHIRNTGGRSPVLTNRVGAVIGNGLRIEYDDVGHHVFLYTATHLHILDTGIAKMFCRPVTVLRKNLHERHVVFPRQSQRLCMSTDGARMTVIGIVRIVPVEEFACLVNRGHLIACHGHVRNLQPHRQPLFAGRDAQHDDICGIFGDYPVVDFAVHVLPGSRIDHVRVVEAELADVVRLDELGSDRR